VQTNGIFMIAELGGEAGKRIREINERYDPRLARYKAPHVTITGSSGVGPLPASVSIAELKEKLEPIVQSTPPMILHFSAPVRFMQTDIIVLPLDPHGPLRVFHDRVASCGLPFQQARFTFTPHCTLTLYPTLTREVERELLSMRITEPVVIDHVTMYHTLDPQPSKKLLELRLSAES
jgi:2'-5' RNA ligase